MSGAVSDRPALREALDYARSGDTLIVWKLDRLARSMKQLNRSSYGPLTREFRERPSRLRDDAIVIVKLRDGSAG